MTPASPPRIECAAVRLSHKRERIGNEHQDVMAAPRLDDDGIERAAFRGAKDDIRAKLLTDRCKKAMARKDYRTAGVILDAMLAECKTEMR